jgi:hypothetical protein
MAHQKLQTRHGVVTRAELMASGLSADAIKHRVATGRLHPLWRGVYAVGRPDVTRHGIWMAAVLSCGPQAALSHQSAAALWEMRRGQETLIDVTVPASVLRRRPGK